MLSLSPVVVSDRHDNCINIWNILSSASSLSMKPVLIKSSMTRESSFPLVFDKGGSLLYQNIVIPHFLT